MTTTVPQSGFLVLAPEQSDSYPATQAASRSSSIASVQPVDSATIDKTSSIDTSAVDASVTATAADVTLKTRRSSSTSSSGSGLRFLRLGPVHFGGDPLESDFAEVSN